MYSFLNLDINDQLLVQKLNKDDDSEEAAESLKELFSVFSYVNRKPKKE